MEDGPAAETDSTGSVTGGRTPSALKGGDEELEAGSCAARSAVTVLQQASMSYEIVCVCERERAREKC